VEGTQHDSDDERGGGQLAVPNGYTGADRLQRDVHRAGKAGRIGRLNDLVVSGPQGQPRRPGGRGGVLQAVQHGAAGHEFLARLRAGVRRVGRADGGQVGPVQRGAQRDDPAGLGHAVVLDIP